MLLKGSLLVRAQNESFLQPFWNPVILNPGFAGLDKTTSVRTGNQHYYLNDSAAFNIFYATYDTWSDKLRGGIAIYFKQGIIGQRNISTTEIGFGYSGYPRKTKNGKIRFSAGTDFLMATKQWWVFALDGILLDPNTPPNPPGNGFLQYFLLKPRLGFLWEVESISWGITGGAPIQMKSSADTTSGNKNSLNLSFYLSKKSEGYKKGLHSLPYRLNPELMVFYQNDFILSRFRIYVENTFSTLGLFIQSDFTNKMHTIGGTLGLAREYTRLDISMGAGIPVNSSTIGFCGEVALHLTIPKIDYGKRNPWSVDDR